MGAECRRVPSAFERILTWQTAALLVVAGIAAGLGGSTTGIASVFSYPALLLAGLSPIDANVTNSISLTFLSLGSVIGSRQEWIPRKDMLKKLAPATFLGGLTGAALLLLTPPKDFERVVPFLLIFASIAILIPAGKIRFSGTRNHVRLFQILAGVIGIYCGYFGAASGTITIALMIQMLGVTLPVAHSMKNVLLGIANGVAAVIFVFSGHVNWLLAIPLAVGFYIGGRLGPIIVRKAPQKLLKYFVVAAGFALAVWLFTHQS